MQQWGILEVIGNKASAFGIVAVTALVDPNCIFYFLNFEGTEHGE